MNDIINSRWKLDRNGMRIIVPRTLAHYCDTTVLELPPGLEDEDNAQSLEIAQHVVDLHNAYWDRTR